MTDNLQSRIQQAATYLEQGNLPSAHFALKKILRDAPHNVDALILQASLRMRKGDRTGSEDLVNQLFENSPENFSGQQQQQLAHLCFENELFFSAAKLFVWARQKKAVDALSLYRIGVCMRRQGEMALAERNLLECLQYNPAHPAPYLQLGHLYKATGKTDRAVQNYKKYIDLTTDAKGTGYWCLADLKSYKFDDNDIEQMELEMSLGKDSPSQVSALHFALGWAFEDRGNYERAIRHYKEGNKIQAELKPFESDQYRRIIAQLETVSGESSQKPQDNQPTAILIVGLPRSGTTLIEQILSAHPRVQATDELPYLEKIALRLEMAGGYTNRLLSMTQEERSYLRAQYLNGAKAHLRHESDFFIDKYPGNFLHIGLAKRIMPEAIIIDARRDPRDIAISAYRQLFNARNEFAASFDGIYDYYSGYSAIMKHWQAEYPEQIKTLHYEQLVSAPDEWIATLLNFCGLESNSACFEFYKNKRPVMTPSVNQVSKPMYTSSVAYWRHFEQFIGNDLSRLGTLVDSE